MIIELPANWRDQLVDVLYPPHLDDQTLLPAYEVSRLIMSWQQRAEESDK